MSLVGLTSNARATAYYVDAVMGNDNYSGRNPPAPWLSLYKVNHFRFQRGDTVRLARGSVWRETLEPSLKDDANFGGVTFTAYAAENHRP
jgi:hypothetical protein